jgi:hypothetical protein
MWLTTIWVLSVIVCSDPDTPEARCTPHVLGPFISRDYCDLNATLLAEALQPHKPAGTPMSIEATCFAGTPDRVA